MPEPSHLHDPWLVAVWPGMGNVAITGGAYMVAKLGAQMVHEITSRDIFEVPYIEVQEGLARAGRLPRSLFFEWRDPAGRHDLLIFIGEAQPPVRGYAFCHKLLDYAQQRGVTRVFTFAALATQLHPSNAPRVFGVATDRRLIDDLQRSEVLILKEGQISGLNGVLLAAAAERNVPGVCLLGELPFFAAGVPNPKASHAVLEVFSTMSGVPIDFADIKRQAETVEKGLLELLRKMQEAARQQQEQQPGEEGFTMPEFTVPEESSGAEEGEKSAKSVGPSAPALDYATRKRIEAMFQTAGHDRAKAFHLKEELDRLGVFKQYEDRFLDLFKKAE